MERTDGGELSQIKGGDEREVSWRLDGEEKWRIIG